jgi:hypothetical protein
MPMPLSSRYASSLVYTVDDPQRGPVATVAIREPTPPAPGTQMYRHLVAGVETIESLAQRFYGTSDTWWRIAEANPLFFPLDARPGFPLHIPGVGEVGRIVRTRRF